MREVREKEECRMTVKCLAWGGVGGGAIVRQGALEGSRLGTG